MGKNFLDPKEMFDLRKIGTKKNFESKKISSEKDFGLKKTDIIKWLLQKKLQ